MHISAVTDGHCESVRDFVNEGDSVRVVVLPPDDRVRGDRGGRGGGSVRLSMRMGDLEQVRKGHSRIPPQFRV